MRACFIARVNADYGSCAQRLILGSCRNFGSRNPPISFIVFAAGRTYSSWLKMTCAAQSYSTRCPMAASSSLLHPIAGDGLANTERNISSSALAIGKPAAVSFTRVCSFNKARMTLPGTLSSGFLVTNSFRGSLLRSSLTFSLQCYSNGAAPDAPLTNEQLGVTSDLPPQLKSPDQATLKLTSGSYYLPHPDKVKTGGEDAHFICQDEYVVGVADGVGGWADVGIDAGEYARQLMSNSVSSIKNESKESVDPLKVLEHAYEATNAQGSSTACIVALTDEGIRAINVGDSGFVVIRDGSTVFQSPSQQYGFNFPYQLGNDPGADVPSSGQVFEFPVKAGDVIVAGTDGLFDNLYNNEISAIVVNATRVHLDPKITAEKIATRAQQRAMDKSKQTPFSASAQGAGYRFYGGKLDDITVVVSYVTDRHKL